MKNYLQTCLLRESKRRRKNERENYLASNGFVLIIKEQSRHLADFFYELISELYMFIFHLLPPARIILRIFVTLINFREDKIREIFGQ